MIKPVTQTREFFTTKQDDSFANFAPQAFQKKSLETEHSNSQIATKRTEDLAKNNETVAEETQNQNNLREEQKSANRVGFEDMGARLSELTGMTQVYFQFELDVEEQKGLIMKVFDKKTDEMLQQYPSELSLKIAQMLEGYLGRGQIANATV